MTGVADLYLFLKRPHSKDAQKRLFAIFSRRRFDLDRFVVLSWKRTGSNLLCGTFGLLVFNLSLAFMQILIFTTYFPGILHNHPEIIMHNELFNQIDIHTYHPEVLMRKIDLDDNEVKWNYLTRDLWPEVFLDHIWSGRFINNEKVKPAGKAVGFKSFADHFVDTSNDDVLDKLLNDFRVKKIVLRREDELAVYVSMMRAESTGIYMGNPYPVGLKVRIDVAKFQAFIGNYRRTFEHKYRGPFRRQDTFHITYEQLQDESVFDDEIAPLLWDFLGVSRSSVRRLDGVVRQSQSDQGIESVISNYSEVEYAFRHTDLGHFATRKPLGRPSLYGYVGNSASISEGKVETRVQKSSHTWSILLPICSRVVTDLRKDETNPNENTLYRNRFALLEHLAEHNPANQDIESKCWERMFNFASSFKNTVSQDRQKLTEFVVGIDTDDAVFNVQESKDRIRKLFRPSAVVFVEIKRPMYGKVCRIWSRLGSASSNEFIVLLGDDIILLDDDWQEEVENRFREISTETSLPFGVAAVALSDGKCFISIVTC